MILPAIIVESLPKLLDGTWVTIELTGISLLFGLCLAIPFALLRLSTNPLCKYPAYAFILYFRGTPMLVQIFLIYYGSGQFREFLTSVGLWVFFREAYFCSILSMTLNTAAYTAEILRGAIEAVPYGEIEAGRALGMGNLLLHRRIILPKAFRLAWPAYTNEVVFLLQASSLVSIITVMDITGVARVIAARSFAIYEVYLTAAVFYLVIVYGLLYFLRKIELRITAHLRERASAAEPGNLSLGG